MSIDPLNPPTPDQELWLEDGFILSEGERGERIDSSEEGGSINSNRPVDNNFRDSWGTVALPASGIADDAPNSGSEASIKRAAITMPTTQAGLETNNLPVVANYIAPAVFAQSIPTTYTVTNTNDSGAGSLRQAILNANANPGADTIVFTGSVFTDSTPDTIRLLSMLPIITDDLTITGTGVNNLRISGDANNNGTNNTGDVRIFFINRGNVSITNLSLVNGRGEGGDGKSGGGGGAGMGGAVFINGLYDGAQVTTNVSFTNIAFINNRAIGGRGADINYANDNNFYAGGGGGGGFGGDGGEVNLRIDYSAGVFLSEAGGGGGGFSGNGGRGYDYSGGGGGGYSGNGTDGSYVLRTDGGMRYMDFNGEDLFLQPIFADVGQGGTGNGSPFGGGAAAGTRTGITVDVARRFSIYGRTPITGGGGGVGGGGSGGTVNYDPLFLDRSNSGGSGGIGGGGGGGSSYSHAPGGGNGGDFGGGGGGGSGLNLDLIGGEWVLRQAAGNGGAGGFAGGGGGAGNNQSSQGGVGGFGGGGGGAAPGLSRRSGAGGFGGGNGSGITSGVSYALGGGGAGMGGAVFIRSGNIQFNNVSFDGNSATGGFGSNNNSGQGIGGAVFAVTSALSGAAGVSTAPVVTYNGITFSNNTSSSINPNSYGLYIVNPDTATAREAGGLNNNIPGINPTGNVLSNDANPNNNTNGVTIIAVRTGSVEGQGTEGTVGTGLQGSYGTFTLNADGSYSYALDNNAPAVQALNAGNSLTESFNYTIRNDLLGRSDTTTLTLTINGSNDKPILDTPASPPNIVDTSANDSFTPISGTLTSSVDPDSQPTAINYGVAGGTVAGGMSTLNGSYGVMSVNVSTGAYTYTPDNNRINPLTGNVIDRFTFTVNDEPTGQNLAGVSTSLFTINLQGTNDTPRDLNLSSSLVSESRLPSSLVGIFSTIDVDNTSNFTYSLVDGEGSTDNGYFFIDGDRLRVRIVPDFETKPVLRIRVRTTDPGGLYYDESFDISVLNEGEPPTDITLSPDRIDENVNPGTFVATLSTTDGDNPNDSHYYQLIAIDQGFSIEGDRLRINFSPNFEAQSVYSLFVKSTDNSLINYIYKILTLNINDVNEAPTALNISTSNIDENRGANAIVGNFTTTDPDANNTFTYALVTGEGIPDNEAFTIDGNSLKINDSADFESKPVYNIRVSTTDQNGLNIKRDLEIRINDVNEAPTDINLSSSNIDENSPANTIVGNLSTTDPDANDAFTHTLVGGDGDYVLLSDNFSVPNNTSDLNYNLVARQSGSLTANNNQVNWIANGSNQLGSIVFPIDSGNYLLTAFRGTAALDRNFDDSVSPTGLEIAFKLAPNVLDAYDFTWGGIRLGQSANDKNAGIDSGANGFGILFRGNGGIQAFDAGQDVTGASSGWGGPGNGFGLHPFTIRLTDPNDRNPFDGIGQTNIDVYSGTTLIYSYVKGNGGYRDNYINFTSDLFSGVDDLVIRRIGLFAVSGNQLKVNSPPDYEAASSYNLRIRTTDRAGLSYEKDVTVNINDVNDRPTNITLSNTNIAENLSPNTLIGNLTTADQDANESFTYELVGGIGDDNNSSFSVSGEQLFINASANFENLPVYKIRVKTTDSNGLNYEKDLEINVNNVNEVPTNVTLSVNRIDENIAANTVIGQLLTTDPDGGDSFTYTFIDGQGTTNNNAFDNSAFTINGNQLVINNSPNFEIKSSYNIRVRTTDRGGLFYDKNLSIAVNDINDPPTNITLTSSTIDENLPGSTIVGTLNTIDPDAIDKFTYSINSGEDGGAFSIDENNQILLNGSADFETKSRYNFTIRSIDKGGAIVNQRFTVNVNNIPEIPTGLTLSRDTIDENVPANTLVGTFKLVEPDGGGVYTYSLVGGTGAGDNDSFTINGNGLSINSSPNFETQRIYNVRVKTTDTNSGLTFEKPLTVNIRNVNEAPTSLTLSNNTINENNARGAIIGNLIGIDPDSNDTLTYNIVGDYGKQTLLEDNLRIVSSWTTDNLNVDLGSRQTGSLSPTQWVNNWGTAVLSDGQDDVIGGAYLLLFTYGQGVALDRNFNNTNSYGGLEIGFTLSPDFGTQYTYNVTDNVWGGISLGLAGEDKTANIDSDVEHFGIQFWRNGSIKAFDRNTNITGSYNNWSAGTSRGAFYSFTLRVTDPTDDNPFDGVGQTDIAVYAGNNLVYQYSKGNGGYRDNYISFSSGELAAIDHLTISRLGTFDIQGDKLIANRPLDREQQSSYNLTVKTTDAAGLSVDKNLTVNVNNVNEAPTGITLSATSINEYVPANTTVGNFSTIDPDNNDTFTYTLVAGTGDDDNPAFTMINGNQLQLNSSPDFDIKPSYKIRVRTTDRGGLSVDQLLTITVNDLPGLVIIGTPNNDNLTGGLGYDTLRGLGGNDTLSGLGGDDSLDGGTGNDLMTAGTGNDVYVVDSVQDRITELPNGGIDTVQASISYTLGNNIENLELTGTAINGTGNTLNNQLTGNAGNNILDGKAGNDTLIGGAENDIYILDAPGDVVTEKTNEGIDTIRTSLSYNLTDNFENLALLGSAPINGTGNSANNYLLGNSGNNRLEGLTGNDTLNGSGGDDTLVGGSGTDTYFVDGGDTLVEDEAGVIDNVSASSSYTLEANLENLFLTGTSNINGGGNSLNNNISGNSGNNLLTGSNGNDRLTGGAGNDTLEGNSGNDNYTIDAGDTVNELANEGVDTVNVSFTGYILGDNLENLTVTGTTAIDATGNRTNNILTGNSAANRLNGMEGNDTINGGGGDDYLTGGNGNDLLTGGLDKDTFVLNQPGSGIDQINDFSVVDDTLVVSAADFGGGLTEGSFINTAQLRIGAGATTATNADHRFIYNSTNGAFLFDMDGLGGRAATQIATLSRSLTITSADILVIA